MKEKYISALCHIFQVDQGNEEMHFLTNERVNMIVEKMLSWYRSLPSFTCSYTGNLSDNQIRFRSLLKGQDKNPRELLFEQFQKVFDTEDLNILVQCIKDTKQILDTHMDHVYIELGLLVRQAFGASKEDDIHNILCSWRRRQEDYLSHHICSSSLSKLALLAKQSVFS